MAEIEMAVDSIRVSLMNYQRVIILKEKERERYLPCWVGPAEADSIAVVQQGVAVPRPLTHDFTCTIINALGGKVKCVVINKLENDTFYATTRLECDDNVIEIDCRPSDAIAIALRKNAPIFADEKVLDKAGVLNDAEAASGKGTAPKKPDQIETEKLEKFSAPVREIFIRAEEQAGQLNSKCIGSGHLLLALVEKAPNTASAVLISLGIDLMYFMSAVKLSIDEEQPSDLNKAALNDNAKRVIQLAVEEARRLASQQVLLEHLLIGMVREDTGCAGKVLRAHGVDVDKIYAELIRFHNQAQVSKQSEISPPSQGSTSWEPETEALKPYRCPQCKKDTLFWNSGTQLFECHNRKCKHRFTKEDMRHANPDS